MHLKRDVNRFGCMFSFSILYDILADEEASMHKIRRILVCKSTRPYANAKYVLLWMKTNGSVGIMAEAIRFNMS